MSDSAFRQGSGDSDKKLEAEQFEVQQSAIAPPTTFGGKVKRHFARFWWLHLIVFCAGFLIIALCLVYVAMPKIAQHGVNESSLNLTDIEFLSPTPNSILLKQTADLHSPSIYTPKLDAFNASLYLVTNGTLASAPMISVPVPALHVRHPDTNITIETNATFISADQIAAFSTEVISQEYVSTALVGKTKLHEGHLPVTTVNYHTISTIDRLRALS